MVEGGGVKADTWGGGVGWVRAEVGGSRSRGSVRRFTSGDFWVGGCQKVSKTCSSKAFCEEVGRRSGIGISTNLGQDSRWEWLVYVILRVWWVGDEIIKFEKDV